MIIVNFQILNIGLYRYRKGCHFGTLMCIQLPSQTKTLPFLNKNYAKATKGNFYDYTIYMFCLKSNLLNWILNSNIMKRQSKLFLELKAPQLSFKKRVF